MGFCFGGLCALDLARSNADNRGAVSIHGMLKPSGLTEPKVRAKVLMLHAYGHTVHAFTNPVAQNRDGGMQYDEAADRRSWHALEEILAEALK
jgi:dienelactone hydrolase